VKYREFTGLNLPSIEKEILDTWNREQAFEKSISLREGSQPFVFYEGPPSANGMPGIHHVISRTLKDMICRYKTMRGFQVKRKGGWDTHGLPVELGVEKELGITKEDIGKKISVEEYNRKCREAVLRYKDKWDDLTRKMGYWVDLNDPYITFENEYIETLWWLLSELYKKGLLYESVSIQPYSPAAGTGLSSHELNQPGTYKDVKDTSCVAMFRAVRDSRSEFLFAAAKRELSPEVFFLAWTTTPWTLPSNLGLTVGAQIDYSLVSTFNPYTHLPVNVIMATPLLGKYFKPEAENADPGAYTAESKILPWKIIAEYKGKDLEECRYEQLLAYPANDPSQAGGDPFRVLLGDFVTTEDGTGIVHTSPAFGADDFRVGQKYGIGILTMVDREGKFVDGLGEFSNRFVKNYKSDPAYSDVNVDICVKLKKENRAFRVEKYEHSYPHCWRTDKPILYYPLDAWFIKTTAVKDRMVELNKTINWKPASTGEGRFGNWLENMVDWNLSRSRYWGTPLPIWRNELHGREICIGSLDELKKNGYLFDAKKFSDDYRRRDPALVQTIHSFFKTHSDAEKCAAAESQFDKLYEELSVPSLHPYAIASADIHFGVVKDYLAPLGTVTNMDLHKPMVDHVVLVEDGKLLTRVPDLVDVWFDSGAMPYAQWHYPFANKEMIDAGKAFPADFIAEGVDQTRGWFYTLHALAVMLFDSVAYKTVVSNGLVLDKNGNKMSKRLGNMVDPFTTIDQFGADATRWYLITNASPWDNLKFDLEGIREVQRKFFGTLYNTYQFFSLYANVDGFSFSEKYIPVAKRPEIDRWVLSSLNTLVRKVTAALDDYEPTPAGRAIEEFVDEHLSNWYVRLCRRRFWKGDYENDKIAAYQTLYECMDTLIRLMAPISPFFSDALFRNLNEVTGRYPVSSVHHADFPVAVEAVIDPALEERMQLAQDTCSLVLSLRKKVNIKVRQPLQKIMIPVLNPAMTVQLQQVEDLVKAEVNVKEVEYITRTEGIIHKKVKPNFKALGNKLGARMKEAGAALGKLSQEQIGELEKNGVLQLHLGNEAVPILISEVEVLAEDIPGWSVASKGSLTVALDITITGPLQKEGDARELVNRVQQIRKESGFELTDRVKLVIERNENLYSSINDNKIYICGEILADDIDWVSGLQGGTEIEVNDTLLKVAVTKKG